MVLRIDRLQDHTLKLVQWEITLERLTQKELEPKAILSFLGAITTIKKNRNCYKTNINIEVRNHSSSVTNEITVSSSWKLYHVCFELAPKETINELYAVNTNSIHRSLPNRTRLPLQRVCINSHNWTGREGIGFGKSWRKANMINNT